MEGFRKAAADSLKSLPKEERPTKLAELQQGAEYWTARAEKLKSVAQKVEFSEDRTTLHWNIKNVYHGTDVPEIDEMKYAEESTIGSNAVYFTVDPTLAMGYAKLRNRERKSGQTFLYEATLSDVNLQNWAEKDTVKKLAAEFLEYAKERNDELSLQDYKDFSKQYGMSEHIQKSTARWALKKIIETCEKEDYLNGGNIKTISQGVMGMFFERFVKERGYDGVIAIEGGDDQEFTIKPGVSVVIFNRAKITSHRTIDINQPQ